MHKIVITYPPLVDLSAETGYPALVADALEQDERDAGIQRVFGSGRLQHTLFVHSVPPLLAELEGAGLLESASVEIQYHAE